MEKLEVSLSPDGFPLAFSVAGDRWNVIGETVRWYERVAWWETESRMPPGRGRIDVEVWQLQANLDAGGSAAAPVTVILVRNQNAGEWQIRSMVEDDESTVDHAE